MMHKLIPIFLIMLAVALLIAPTATVMAATDNKITAADNKAKKDIITAESQAVENHFSKYNTINATLGDSNQSLIIYNKTSENQPPPPPTNQPPTLVIDSPVKCTIGTECQLTIEQVKDNDGNITSIVWKQTDKNPPVGLKVFSDFMSAVFNVTNAGLYGFTVTATDNHGAATAKQFAVTVPKANDTNPQPTAKTTKIIFVGDLKGTVVYNAVVKAKPDLTVANGDLTYGTNLDAYKQTYGKLVQKCNQGNHDAKEDGGAFIDAQTLAYCGQHWFYKTANATTMIIGFTTNGDNAAQVKYANAIIGNSTLMKGVKNLILTSHKNGHVPPQAHHPAEAVGVYGNIVHPAGVRVIEVNAHNHFAASADTKDWYISGNGGKSHYDCKTDQVWGFCNTTDYGYLQFEINNGNAAIKINFYDTAGKILH